MRKLKRNWGEFLAELTVTSITYRMVIRDNVTRREVTVFILGENTVKSASHWTIIWCRPACTDVRSIPDSTSVDVATDPRSPSLFPGQSHSAYRITSMELFPKEMVRTKQFLNCHRTYYFNVGL